MLQSPGFGVERPLPPLGSLASGYAAHQAGLPKELSELILEEIHCSAQQEQRHLQQVNGIYQECEDKVAQARSSAARKAHQLKDRAAHASARAGELEQRLVLAAAELQMAKQRIVALEDEKRHAALSRPVPPGPEMPSHPSALELEMERLRHSREVLAAQTSEARRDAAEARQALGREGAVAQSLQRDLDASRQRLLHLQSQLADSANENAVLTRDLEAERVRAAATRREQEELAAAHEAVLSAARSEAIRFRQQRDALGEDAAAANARLRRLKRESACRRLFTVAERRRRVVLSAAMRSWAAGAALACGAAEVARQRSFHAREVERLNAEARAMEAAQRQARERSKKVSAACSILVRVASARAEAQTSRRAAFLQWRSVAVHLLASEVNGRIGTAQGALRAKEDELRRCKAELTAAKRAIETLEAQVAEHSAAAAAAAAHAASGDARAAAAWALVRRLRVAALRRVAASQARAHEEVLTRDVMSRWRRVCARMKTADTARRRSVGTSPAASRRGSANSQASAAVSRPAGVNTSTMTEPEPDDVAPPPPLPAALPLSPPPPPLAAQPTEEHEPPAGDSPADREAAAASPAVRSPPQIFKSPPFKLALRPPLQIADADAALALLGDGDVSSLPRLMQQLRVRIGEELYSVGEQLLRVVEADHVELYGNQYQPQPVTEVERLHFSAKMADAARGRLRWLLVVYLRTYESVKALLDHQDHPGVAAAPGAASRRRPSSAAAASLAERRARRVTNPEDEADLASLRLGPNSTPGDRSRAARVLRNRLITLLEEAADIWMRRRRGVVAAGSPSGAAALGGGARRVRRRSAGAPHAPAAFGSSTGRDSRPASSAAAGYFSPAGGGGGGGGGDGGGGDGWRGRAAGGAAGLAGSGGAAGAAAALELEERRRALVLKPSAKYLDTGAGPRQYWEAIAGSRFVDAEWDVPLSSLERQAWRLALLPRSQDSREGLRLRRADSQRKVLDQRVYELLLLYTRTVIIWEGTGVPGLAESGGGSGGSGVSGGGGGGGGGSAAGAEEQAPHALLSASGGGALELTAHDISMVADALDEAGGEMDDDEGGALAGARQDEVFLA